MTWEEARTMISALALLVSGMLVPMLMRAIAILRDVRSHVEAVNARVGVLETWRNDHEKLDDERHEQHRREFAELLHRERRGA